MLEIVTWLQFLLHCDYYFIYVKSNEKINFTTNYSDFGSEIYSPKLNILLIHEDIRDSNADFVNKTNKTVSFYGSNHDLQDF